MREISKEGIILRRENQSVNDLVVNKMDRTR